MIRILTLAGLLSCALLAEAAATRVDLEQSRIEFVSRQMGVPVAGHFAEWSADIHLDGTTPANSHARLVVETASIATGSPEADTEVRRRSWLDVAGFPRATFTSSNVRRTGTDRFEASGTLTIKDRSHDIHVPFTVRPDGDGQRVSGEFRIRRADFNVGSGMWADFDVVANDVVIRFAIRLLSSGDHS